VSRLSTKFGGRAVVGAGFILMVLGFGAMSFVTASWTYAALVLPIVAVAVGMGLANGPASAASTSSVPKGDVGAASGLSNMMRYIGAAVATAAVAAIYDGQVPQHGATGSDLAAGLAGAAVLMGIASALGIALLVLFKRLGSEPTSAVVGATAHLHTIPTSDVLSTEPATAG
jgi:MFS family permease